MTIAVKNVSAKCGDKLVHMQFIFMNSSIFVWISTDAAFHNLAMAMPSRFVCLAE